MRAHYFFSETDHSSTLLTIYLGWIPRNFAGYLFLKISENVFKKNLKKMLDDLKSKQQNSIGFNILKGSEKYAVIKPSAADKDHEEKFNPIRDYLIDHGVESSLIDRLLNYILNFSILFIIP